MLKCESVKPQLSAYLDREMPLWKVQFIRWHLKRCPTCAYEAMRLQQTDAILHQLDPVKTSDSFLSNVLRQVSTIIAYEKQRIPWIFRVLRRLESSLAWARYSLQSRIRPYTVATALALIMTIASLATFYRYQWLSLSSGNIPVVVQSQRDKPTVLVEFEIVSIEQPPKPHLYRLPF